MLNPVLWRKILGQPARNEPLAFAAGIRHTVRKNYYCGMHSHPAVEIVYHPTGKGTTRLAGQKIPFAEGSAVIYAPGEEHDQAMTEDGDDLCVQIALPARLRGKLRGGFFVPHIGQSWLTEEIAHLCRSRAQPGGLEQRIFDLRATAVLLALLDLATAVSREHALPSSERHVLQAEQFISEHFSTLRSLREVAEHVGLSHDHLRHLFKQARGKSLVHHLNEVKVSRAKILLASSPLPLKQIAALCGFQDEYYFSAVFRKLTHFPPGWYRQKSSGA